MRADSPLDEDGRRAHYSYLARATSGGSEARLSESLRSHRRPTPDQQRYNQGIVAHATY